MKNPSLRKVVREVLSDQGFTVRDASGQGYLPGTNLVVSRGGKQFRYAVKASQHRAVSFTRLENHHWRTLRGVDRVIVAVPARPGSDAVQLLEFRGSTLVKVFDQAWDMLASSGRTVGFGVPVFVPLDRIASKNVGHAVANLKRKAVWSALLTKAKASELLARQDESYIVQFRRRFAAENGVSLAEVIISIRKMS